MDRLGFTFHWQRRLILLATLLNVTSTLAQNCNSTITPTAPDSRYQAHGDGTVTDLQTGLMWQQCSMGRSGVGCVTGNATFFTWDEAFKQTENLNISGGFAGHSDWRLPNRNELESLVEEGCLSPAINYTIFPNTPNSPFWSSSPANNSNSAWIVYFYDGSSYYDYLRGNHVQVRLVRNGEH